MAKTEWDIIILGSGPAGLTAALYASRANLKPLVLEGGQPGGQLTITTDVENYPGFPQGIMGPELVNVMREQCEKFGTTVLQATVESVELDQNPIRLKTDGNPSELTCRALIVATGASAKLLGLASEEKLMGHGVSACATCDGFFFKEKELIVVGGGDSAMEEATFLTKFASRVNVVHRREGLRASKIMEDRARNNPKINFVWNSEIQEILGSPEDGVRGVLLKDTKNGSTREFSCQGVFMAIGHLPNTALFKDKLELDPAGYLVIKPGTTKTSVKGVFAAGDVADSHYRQAITAAGTGCMAAIDAERYLGSLE